MKSEGRTYRHIIKYTGFFGGTQVLNLLAALVRNKIAAVLIGPAGLGLMSLYNAAVKLLNESTGFGIPTSAVKYVAEALESGDRDALRRTVRSVRLWSLLTAVLGALACILLSPLLGKAYLGTSGFRVDFLWLSPVVAMAALTAGELALLKGARCLRQVALQSVVNAVGCLAVTLPFFYFYGVDGVIPALVAAAFVAAATTFCFSLRRFPYASFCPAFRDLRSGFGMLRLGTALVVAGILGSAVEFLVRAFIARTGSVADVGLYNAGYVITVTYASVVFMSMETDFYPRLSAVNHDREKAGATVNRQIEVSVLLLSPLLIVFLLLLPVLLPMLYSQEFLPVIGMAQFGTLAMLLRAVMLPMEYVALAKGRSRVYLLTEGLYDAVAVACLAGGYHYGGLDGCGAGLLVAAAFNFMLDWIVCRRFFGLTLNRKVLSALAVQLLMVGGGFFTVRYASGAGYWIWGVLLAALSATVSFVLLRDKAGFMRNKGEDENIDSDSSL